MVQGLETAFINNISSKQIYLYENPKFPEKKHFHIILNDDSPFLYVVCTSKKETLLKIYKDEKTLVELKYNIFTKETYVNCHNIFSITTKEIKEKIKKNETFIYKEVLTEEDYQKILKQVYSSKHVEKKYLSILSPYLDLKTK